MGSPVDLVVSRGHAPERIPAVVGKRWENAERLLASLGFEIEVREDFSQKVPRGHVIAVDPEVGTTQDYGSAVTVTVSVGPEHFPCPSFIDMSRTAAQALAKEHDFALAFLAVPGTDGSNVISQLPGAGETCTYGQTVTLYMA
jgi:serine/threonine-protein kinase